MTAEEFISACKSGGTVEVDSDIDFNSHVLAAGELVVAAGTIINGNGHTLTNIQSNERAFYFEGAATINRLNIRNVNLPEVSGTLFYSITNAKKTLNECQISGIMYTLHEASNAGWRDNMDLYRCSLTVERFYALFVRFDECYVVVGQNQLKGSNSAQYYLGIGAKNTYFKGQLDCPDGDIIVGTEFNNCCINIDVVGINSFSPQRSTNLISIFNTDKVEGNYFPEGLIKGVTDAEMHDAKALYDKGFAIYVP